MVADELKLQLSVIWEIFEEFQPIAERIGFLEEKMRLISNNFDNIQTAVRKVKQDSTEFKLIVDTLQDKMARLEDKSRQCNICLVCLAEGEEGSDSSGFMQTQLPLCIMSLKNRSIEIDRAHRIYTSDSNRKDPRTLIFKLLLSRTETPSSREHELRDKYSTRATCFSSFRTTAIKPS